MFPRRVRFVTIWVVALIAAGSFSTVRGMEHAALTLENEGLESWGGLPPAALAPEPVLPEPSGWSFGDGFPRTSGTGRYARGAYFWSDFLYDDRGAATAASLASLAQTQAYGGYTYPEPNAANNGADIFRAGVGLELDATVWRVDWNTLIDPDLPIAAFGIDLDADTTTGGTLWPANVGVRSPGIDRLLVLSSRTARLIDVPSSPAPPVPLPPALVPAPSGAVVDLPVMVDLAARSFLVRVPSTLLPVEGESTIRLAAGLADDTGTAFRTLDAAHRALPGQPNVYNLGYRGYDLEATKGSGVEAIATGGMNPWFEHMQARHLGPLLGDVSPFHATIDWDRLTAADTEPEPIVTGMLINRWYVSSVELHQGIHQQSGDTGAGSLAAAAGTNIYGNRVQPYALHIPSTYDPATPSPLTFILHASGFNHNTERALSPNFQQGACEDRNSICVSPLGRAETLFWLGLAELDFWEVWNRVATAYTVDPERTIIGGHSGGGSGTFNFVQDHPDLFAGFYIINSLDATTEPAPNLYLDLAANLRWNPMYHMDSVLDELPPIPLGVLEILRFEELGYRFVFDIHVIEDHFTPALRDDYRNLIEWLSVDRTRETDPGRVTYRWYPQTVDREQGWGPMGAWWVQDVDARNQQAVAQIDAGSAAQPDAAVTPVVTTSPNLFGGPSPSIRRQLDWELDEAPPRATTIDLTFTNVSAVTIDLAGAGFQPDERGVLNVTTDGPVTMTIVRVDGSTASIALDAGQHAIPS